MIWTSNMIYTNDNFNTWESSYCVCRAEINTKNRKECKNVSDPYTYIEKACYYTQLRW